MECIAEEKLKRVTEETTLALRKNPDLLADIGHLRGRAAPILVGFAVETATDEVLISRSRDKLRSKRIDVVVANRASDALGADTNRVWLVTETEQQLVATAPKLVVADTILDWLLHSLSAELDR